MKIYVNIKKAGSRRNVFTRREYELPYSVCTLREFLSCLTEAEVNAYNSRSEDLALRYLSEADIEDTAKEGKVGFGYVHTGKPAVIAVAIEHTMQAYEDGLVRVFRNESEWEGLDQQEELQEGDVFTIMRLTFLSGRMW